MVNLLLVVISPQLLFIDEESGKIICMSICIENEIESPCYCEDETTRNWKPLGYFLLFVPLTLLMVGFFMPNN